MFGRLGLPELILLVTIIVVPLALVYRAGYNSGYRKALEKILSDRPKT